MKKELLEEIKYLADIDKPQEVIDLIEKLPAESLDSEIIGQLARAYNNVENYEKAVEILKSIEFEEKNNPIWHYRIAFSYYYMDNFEEAINHLLKALELMKGNKELEEDLKEDVENFLTSSYSLYGEKIFNEGGDLEIVFQHMTEAFKYSKEERILSIHVRSCAKIYKEIGEYEKAEEMLKNEIERGKKDFEIYNLLGETLSAQEKNQEALDYYLLAKEYANEESEYFISCRIAWLYGRLENYEKELEYLNIANEDEEGEDDIWFLSEYGQTLRFLGKPEEALKYFDVAEKLGRDDIWINVEKAICLNNLNRPQEALEYYLKVEKEGKDNIGLLSEIAWTYRILGDTKAAKKYLNKAKKLGRDDVWIKTEYALVDLKDNKFDLGIKKFKEIIKNEKDYDEFFINSQLAWAYEQIEDYKKALPIYLKLKNMAENDERIDWSLAYSYLKVGEYEKSLDIYLKLYETNKEDTFLLVQIGWLYSELDNQKDGIEFLLKAEELGRDDIWLKAEIGRNLCYIEGRVTEGIERIETILTTIDLSDESLIGERIFLHSELGYQYSNGNAEQNLERALKNLYEVEKLGREDAWINSQIGYCLCFIGTETDEGHRKNLEEAYRRVKKAMELGREDAWVFRLRGQVTFELKKYEEALEYYKKAYELTKHGWVLCDMGRCQRRLGQYKEAIKTLLKSRKESEDEGEVTNLEDKELAYCYAALGDREKAEKYMQLSLDSLGSLAESEKELREDFAEIKEMIKSLGRMS